MRLEGKVALITGGSRGMGAAMARLFAQEGAKVVIGDILEAEGRQVEAEITQAGGEARFVRLDVTREDEWRQAIDTAVSQYGKLNVLVHNAGIIRLVVEGGVHRAMKLEEMDPEAWDEVIDVNLKGTYLGTRLAIPEMRKAGGGSIIIISSVGGLTGSASSPAYGASKGAVRIFAKNVAIQYAKDGIRANSIHPGYIETPMIKDLYADPEFRQAKMREVPLDRLGRPEDVAYGALYLASDESSFVTGSELVIDGGIYAQ